MGPEVVNKNKNCVFNGPYAGRDLYITMYQDSEREFVVTHNVNIKPVSYFTGRETELDDLRQRIEEGRKSVLVSGMGGIGKTQICRKLFEEYYIKHGKGENGSFRHIGYIEYSGDMDSSLMKCLRYKEQDNPELNKEAAWRELEDLASEGNLLLFVDNVDKSGGADAGLKRLNAIPGAVVLTSRRTSLGKEFEQLKIGFLSTEQCKKIYERIRYEDSDRKVPEEDVPDLEYVIVTLAAWHTITIEFLAHLAETKRWSVKKLRDELQEKGFCLEYKDDEEKLVNIQKSYEALYDLSELIEAEQNILEAFSVFPYIPLAAEICNEWLLMDAGCNKDDDVLVGLCRKGWLKYDEKQESYSMHPVFAQFIYEKCKPRVDRHNGLIENCQKSLEVPENGSVLECQRFLIFAEKIIEKINMDNCVTQTDFIFAVAKLMIDVAEYDKAIKQYEELIKIYESKYGKTNSYIVRVYNNLAVAYDMQGEYDKAKELYMKSLKLCEGIYGENHSDTIGINYNLAGIYSKQGEFEWARELYEKCLEICMVTYGENHSNTTRIYSGLAALYERKGNYEKAKILYEKCLGTYIKEFGETHPRFAKECAAIASVYCKQGNYEKAKAFYQKCLDVYIRTYGETHPETARIYNNLAAVYEEKGDYERAKELYEKSLSVREGIYEENHPDLADSYNNLATLYRNQGEYKIAETLYKNSIKICQRVYGEIHPNTIRGYINLATLYEIQGKYDRAKDLYEKNLTPMKKLLGEEHPDIISLYSNLAGIYEREGQYNKAKELYEKCLRMSKKVLGEMYFNTA